MSDRREFESIDLVGVEGSPQLLVNDEKLIRLAKDEIMQGIRIFTRRRQASAGESDFLQDRPSGYRERGVARIDG